MSLNKTQARAIAAKDKQAKALELRRQGYLLREIADALELDSPATACNIIKRALHEVIREPAEEVIQLELDRLDSMFVAAYNRAANQELPFSKEAVETCLRVMERRAKLLGIDKPTKVASTDPTGEQETGPVVRLYLPHNNRDTLVPT